MSAIPSRAMILAGGRAISMNRDRRNVDQARACWIEMLRVARDEWAASNDPDELKPVTKEETEKWAKNQNADSQA